MSMKRVNNGKIKTFDARNKKGEYTDLFKYCCYLIDKTKSMQVGEFQSAKLSFKDSTSTYRTVNNDIAIVTSVNNFLTVANLSSVVNALNLVLLLDLTVAENSKNELQILKVKQSETIQPVITTIEECNVLNEFGIWTTKKIKVSKKATIDDLPKNLVTELKTYYSEIVNDESKEIA